MISKVRAWFTAKRRQAIYAGAAALAPILVTFGVITDGQTEFVLTLTAAGLQGFAGVLALLNLSWSGAASWFVVAGRATIYGLAATVAPAAVGLGLLPGELSVNILTGLSLGLTALQALISVIHITPSSIDDVSQAARDIVVVHEAQLTAAEQDLDLEVALDRRGRHEA